jgi:hypothetical protein
MSVLYADSSLPSGPPSDALRLGMDITWESNGFIWDLCSGVSGVYLLSGTRGLHMPTGTRFRDTSPAVHGSQHRGHVWNEREVFWPLKTWHPDAGQSWVDRDGAFFAGLDPTITGRWTVTQPGGISRYLDLRYEPSTSDDGFEILPSLTGWARYGVYMIADQPFWVGAPSVKSWEAPTEPEPFLEPTGPHLLNITQGFSFSTASIDNNGDVPSYIQWFVDGLAQAGSSVGVGGNLVSIPFEVPVGKCLVIESDPTRIGATLYDVVNGAPKPYQRVIGIDMVNPVDVSGDLGEADFGSVSPGKSIPLQIEMAGSGIVEAYLPNLYKRAWGSAQNNGS